MAASARIGEMVVSKDRDEELVALGLGSCIGLVIADPRAGVAGLAHVMLPDSGGSALTAGKFADTAVPALLAKVLALGGNRGRLGVAMAGGASMFGSGRQLDVGARNIEAVTAALSRAGLRCHAAHTGGEQGRTVRVKVGTGVVTTRVVGGTERELLSGERENSSLRRAA